MADAENRETFPGGKNFEEEKITEIQKKIEDKVSEDEILPEEKASVELSKDRTHMSEHRTHMSEHRTNLSEHRTGLSEHRTDLSEHRTDLSDKRTIMSYQRTALSYERTLMSWIRTSTSLISFGFTIYKVFQELNERTHQTQKIFTPRVVGMVMIGFGFLSLLIAQLQHERALKNLKQEYPGIQRSLSSLLSIMILIFGLVLFLAALFRQ